MCGIIGYIGRQEAVPILVEGLRKLEYRGYDSSGVGVISSLDGHIEVRKTQGKISDLAQLIQTHHLPAAHIGISHTRWATHGVPNRVNAHPHFDCSERILVVHNGIIENYEELKSALKKRGHKFISDTDTEVVAHLIEENNTQDLCSSV
ncbi:MAG: class II glutamine amidotransferase, partial [Candidatus Omnitrophota bacterium]